MSKENTVEDQYMFSDYFSDPEDPGVPVDVIHRGKSIPFRIRRQLSLGEKQLANDAAVEFSVGENGMPTVKKVDQAAFMTEICLIAIKEWPFKYPTGKRVPINRQTISKLDSILAEKVSQLVLGVTALPDMTPFEMKLDEDSLPEEVPTHA